MSVPFHSLLKKMQMKPGQQFLVLRVPDEMKPLVDTFEGHVDLDRLLNARKQYDAIFSFVQSEHHIRNNLTIIANFIKPDGLIWMAYPKKTSKRFNSSVTRDNGWESLGQLGYEAVRQIAIDEDWSALRFRHIQFIKELKREGSRVMSPEGKLRLNKD